MIHNITVLPIVGLPGATDDTASVAGAVLMHNGTEYDLSTCPDGGALDPSGEHPFGERITRIGSTLTYAMRMAYDPKTANRAQPKEPTHWQVSLEDEAVPDLVERKEVPE